MAGYTPGMGPSFANPYGGQETAAARDALKQMMFQQMMQAQEAQRQAGMAPRSQGAQHFGQMTSQADYFRQKEAERQAIIDREMARQLQGETLEAASSKNQRMQQAFGGNTLGDIVKMLMGRIQNGY